MYTLHTNIKLNAGCLTEFRRLLKETIIPLLRTQPGFRDEITLVTAKRNRVIAISFWDTQASADAYNHIAYLDVLRALSKIVPNLPVVETFELVDSTLPPFVVSAA